MLHWVALEGLLQAVETMVEDSAQVLAYMAQPTSGPGWMAMTVRGNPPLLETSRQ